MTFFFSVLVNILIVWVINSLIVAVAWALALGQSFKAGLKYGLFIGLMLGLLMFAFAYMGTSKQEVVKKEEMTGVTGYLSGIGLWAGLVGALIAFSTRLIFF